MPKTVLYLMTRFILLFPFILINCSRFPDEVDVALKIAGNNRKELEYVIDYYNQDQNDSLKLKAAYFLIQNLPFQFYFEGNSLDIYNQEISKMENLTVTKLKNIWDSIHSIYGDDFIVKKDIDIIDSRFLIENIDMAFKSREIEWSKNISFDEFCEYILPYKISNEKPKYGWRTSLFKNNISMIDSIKNKDNPLEACVYINNSLQKWCKISYDYQYPVDIDFDMASKIQTGSCEFACKMATYPMRAMGIPVSFDYTPDWANRSQRHNWNSVIINGEKKTFNGGESSVGSHKVQYIGVGRIQCKPAKVFRKTYSIQKNTLPFLADPKEEIPDAFYNYKIMDVTSQYTPVSNVHVPVNNISRKHKTAYLCTFNNQLWVLSFWGKRKANEYVFNDMGRDIAYLPVVFEDQKTIPMGDPFVLMKNGEIKTCKANYDQKQTMKILNKYPEDASNNIFPGEEYELLYWDKEWVSAGYHTPDTTFLVYESMPTNAMFWIRNHTKGVQERIFTYENGKQIWW